MVIDINLLRSERGGNPELVRDSERKRGRTGQVVDDILEVDMKWRQTLFELESSRRHLNNLSNQIQQFVKEKDPVEKSQWSIEVETLINESKTVKIKIREEEQKTQKLREKRDALLASIGNIIHPSVVISNDEKDNHIIRMWGNVEELLLHANKSTLVHHHEILDKLEAVELRKGAEIAGHRGYFLKGVGVMLNMALINYGLNFLIRKGYIPIQPPFFMKKNVMQETAELKDFQDTLYRIPKVAASNDSTDICQSDELDEDLFLIATSEQPISALHRKEYIKDNVLPLKYAGISSCFRKESGAHGKDTWGIFRVHQFDKVEQFCITKPDINPSTNLPCSFEMQDAMIAICEEFYQSLGIPYRIVSIASGALNDAASRKYDLEAWFPAYKEYRELVSCSNCTDYQSRSLGIKFLKTRQRNGKEKHLEDYGAHLQSQKKQNSHGTADDKNFYVHMLNGTLVATQRCLCCLVENNQTTEGIKIPPVLAPYMGGSLHIPFTK